MQKPLNTHWKVVQRILRYLKGTIDQRIIFRRLKTLNLTCFSDTDQGNDIDDHRSTTSFCIFLSNNIVSWCSKKQHIVSRSTTEAKYKSLANATSELIWIPSLLIELKIKQNAPQTVWCDNLSTVGLSANPILHSKTKHMKLDLYFVQEKVLQKKLVVNHIPFIDQVADIFTKPLSSQFFERLTKKLTFSPPNSYGQLKFKRL